MCSRIHSFSPLLLRFSEMLFIQDDSTVVRKCPIELTHILAQTKVTNSIKEKHYT